MINTLLSPAGLRLSKTGNRSDLEERVSTQTYLNLVQEIHDLFSEVISPGLPPREGRTELLAGLIGTGVGEAMYLLKYLHESLPHEGDVCEFGVAQGATSALLANEIRATEKNLWLFDSFQGLPKPSEKDQLIDDIFNLKSMDQYEGTMSCPRDMVESKLKAITFPFVRVKIIPGFIEDTITNPPLPDKVCFAYIDFDFYNPILVALRFLNEHLAAGGAIVVDDYGFFSSGAKTAVDEFVDEHREAYELIHPAKFAGHFCVLRKKDQRADHGARLPVRPRG